MDATCAIQASIHVFSLVRKYVSRILGTYHQSALSNREKAVIIDVLKNRYSLPLLLQKLQLSKSSYYYQEQSLQKEDKYTLLRVRVIELFTENKGRYGYRRIHALLKRENIIVSEKVIRRIMKEERLFT